MVIGVDLVWFFLFFFWQDCFIDSGGFLHQEAHGVCSSFCDVNIHWWFACTHLSISSCKVKLILLIIFYFLAGILFFLSLVLFILRERERERTHRGGQREREREFQAGSALLQQSQMQGSNSQTVRSWREPKSRVRRLTDWATQAPLEHFYKEKIFLIYCLIIIYMRKMA